MNKARRKEITKLQERLNDVIEKVREWSDVYEEICNIRDTIETLKDEEEDGYNNLTEALQQTERGQAMQEAAQELDSAHSTISSVADGVELDTLISELEEVFGNLDNAQGV